MSKTRPLSISSTQTYLECPHKFKLQYLDRIRPLTQPSYFIFGSAVDKGLNALLLGEGNPNDICAEELKRLVSEEVEFFPNDYDGELIDEMAKKVLLEGCQKLGYKGDNVDALATTLLSKSRAELSENQRTALALCCSVSLGAKAVYMFDAYRKKVLPLIKRVEGVQQEIRWKDKDGNEFVGVLDMVVDLSGHGSLVADNKTASRPYEPDAVRASPQLAIYTQETKKHKAAFFVLEKQIRKNRVKTCSKCGNVSTGRHKTCDSTIKDEKGDSYGRCGGEWIETIHPEVNIQILIDDVSPSEQAITQEAMSGVANSVRAGCFPKNIKNCEVRFGQRKSRCPYFDYCRSGSMEGLERKPSSSGR